ncbi:MAG: hypothetical protein Q8Q25_01705 [bacterium]|nr:hypothetical protein [bacterium]
MIEVKQLVYHIHQIFKEPEIAGRIAFALILSKSVYNVKNAKILFKKFKYTKEFCINLDEILNTHPRPPLYFDSKPAAKKKQNP